MRTPERGFVIDEVACQSKNPSLSAKRKADRNSNLFEGLSAFLFARMPAAAQGMDKVNPSLSAKNESSKKKSLAIN
jgi:hypothetical protein